MKVETNENNALRFGLNQRFNLALISLNNISWVVKCKKCWVVKRVNDSKYVQFLKICIAFMSVTSLTIHQSFYRNLFPSKGDIYKTFQEHKFDNRIQFTRCNAFSKALLMKRISRTKRTRYIFTNQRFHLTINTHTYGNQQPLSSIPLSLYNNIKCFRYNRQIPNKRLDVN